MASVFCFGELLLRMSPVVGGQWLTKATMPVYIGGAELNVATALAKWNIPVKYGTALPDHYLSKEILADLQQKKIDTSSVEITGERIGTYYLPQGNDLKSAGVIYDRNHSAFAALKPGIINWDKALDDCSWFHFSAICPALNENIAAVCKEALQAATAKGLIISVDLNYRSKLWQYGKLPTQVMPELVKYCQVIMGNIWASEKLLDIEAPIKDSNGKIAEELIDAAGKSMLQLHHQYLNATAFAYTFRLENEYWALLQHGPERVTSLKFLINDVVDKAGSGDCFMAGMIYGLMQQHPPQQVIDFAASAAVGKLYETGDATQQSIEQINARLQNG